MSDDPTEVDTELIEVARAAIGAHSDGHLHTVAASVRDATGDLHTGLNVYHFTGGPCAELVALGAARAAGAGQLAVIVAVGDGGRGVLAPCGRCRQVLADHHPAIRVIVPTSDGLAEVPAPDLLPHRYLSPGR